MVDIEVMFYQVRVLDFDCFFFCFLWWLDGKLLCVVEEYQMIVYLFGVVFFLVCLNFVVCKIVEDNVKDFFVDVLSIV